MAVLALLALRAGEVVSADALVEALWGERPPPTSRTGLQMQISKLRKLLPAADGGLDTRSPGYVLAIDPEQIDVFRFDRAVADAREAAAGGEAARARDLLDRALAEWRGEPLEGIDAPGLDEGVITDLVSRRTGARVAKVEAELALGEHREAMPMLERLMADEPLDERIHALAATALYRAGRQADALEVLARLRRLLSEELGIEPGPTIVDLEARILRHDPDLDVSSEAEPDEPAKPVREGRKTITALACRIDAVGGAGAPSDPEARGGVTAGITELVIGVFTAHGAVPLDVPGELLGAVFGVPQVHEDDVERAIRVATQLLELGSTDGDERTAVRLEMRVGIATGEVLVEAGATERLLSAGPVEEAAQLVRSARAGEVLISDEAAKRSPTMAGSQSELLVLSEGALPTLTRRPTAVPDLPPARHRAPLVGRSDDLTALRNAFDRVRGERSCSVVTLLGPAGVGKSRLVAAFLDEVEDARILRGRCLSYGRDMSLWPVIEMLSGAAGVSFDHPSQQVHKKIAKLLDGLDDADFVERQLTGLLGLTDPASQPDELFWAIRRFLEALGRDRPVIAIVEDAHWADAALLDLVEHVATWIRGTPLLLIVVGRPELAERRSGWGAGRFDATTLVLQPLSQEQGGELLQHLSGDASLTPAMSERILAAAEGNPLFLEEVFAMVTDPAVVGDASADPAPLDVVDVPIPPSVHAILEARLDRLPSDLRRTIERAAVIGKDFTEEELRSITPKEELAALSGVVDQLVISDLIALERVSSSGRAYAFRHILIHDVAEAGAAKRVRALDHE